MKEHTAQPVTIPVDVSDVLHDKFERLNTRRLNLEKEYQRFYKLLAREQARLLTKELYSYFTVFLVTHFQQWILSGISRNREGNIAFRQVLVTLDKQIMQNILTNADDGFVYYDSTAVKYMNESWQNKGPQRGRLAHINLLKSDFDEDLIYLTFTMFPDVTNR